MLWLGFVSRKRAITILAFARYRGTGNAFFMKPGDNERCPISAEDWQHLS